MRRRNPIGPVRLAPADALARYDDLSREFDARNPAPSVPDLRDFHAVVLVQTGHSIVEIFALRLDAKRRQHGARP